MGEPLDWNTDSVELNGKLLLAGVCPDLNWKIQWQICPVWTWVPERSITLKVWDILTLLLSIGATTWFQLNVSVDGCYKSYRFIYTKDKRGHQYFRLYSVTTLWKIVWPETHQIIQKTAQKFFWKPEEKWPSFFFFLQWKIIFLWTLDIKNFYFLLCFYCFFNLLGFVHICMGTISVCQLYVMSQYSLFIFLI